MEARNLEKDREDWRKKPRIPPVSKNVLYLQFVSCNRYMHT